MSQREDYAERVLGAAVLAADTPPPWEGISKSEAVRRADALMPTATNRQLAAALSEMGIDVPQSSIRRARSAPATRQRPGSNNGPDDLSAVWADEVNRSAPAAPVAEGEACPECGGPMEWERARTAIRCPECGTVSLPRMVFELAADQEAQSRALAVRRDPADEHRAVLELAAERERVSDGAASLIDWLAPAALPPGSPARQLAAGYVGQLRYISGMAQRADSPGELASVRDLLNQVANNVAGQRHVLEQAWEASREPAQLEASPDVVDAEWDDYDDEDEQETQEVRQAPHTPGLAYSATALALKRMEADAARRQRNGVCQLRHRWARHTPATREYGPVVPDPYFRNGANLMFAPGGPRIRSCDKHGPAAERELNERGWPHTGYEVLP